MLPLCTPHSQELLQVLSTRSPFLSLPVYNNYPIVTWPTVHCKSDFVQQSCCMLSCLGTTTVVFSPCKILLQGWQTHPHLPFSSGPPPWIAEHFNPGTLTAEWWHRDLCLHLLPETQDLASGLRRWKVSLVHFNAGVSELIHHIHRARLGEKPVT